MLGKTLTQQFSRNYWIIEQQSKGLTHEDSVLQLPVRGNCFNWVLGHILDSRQNALKALNHESLMTDEERARYTRRSPPVTNADDCVRFERLQALLAESQKLITASLESLSAEDLAAIVDEENEQTLADRLMFLNWHETYHTGQFEHLRQLAGTDDSIIP